MKVLVFGKSGQLARALADVADGHVLTFLDRTEADLLHPPLCSRLVAQGDADVIINAAAYTAVDKAEAEEDLARRINTDAPAAIAEAAAARGIPFVHVSTDYVFDGTGDCARRPDESTGPLNVYGRTKRDGELRVAAAGGAYGVLRTSWVFSGYGHNFVKSMLRLGKERESLSIVADQFGGPTAAEDLARAALAVGQNLARGAPSGIHHFAGVPHVSWAEFAREIFAVAGLPTRVIDQASSSYPSPARRPLNSRLDCSSLLTVHGIEPPDWRPALRRVVGQLEEQSHVGS